MTQHPTSAPSDRLSLLKMVLFSALGIILFFVPITVGERSTIIPDHLTTFLVTQARPLAVGTVLLLMLWGAVSPLLDGRFRSSTSEKIFTVFKWLGLLLAVLYLSGLAPAWAAAPDMLPFLFEKLALVVGILIPIGALALTFLLGFGLLEAVGVLMEPVMRPLFRTPGGSAIDAVASFVGSYSIGLLITNRVFLEGKYSLREAAIIATGFSTVSATFMVVVARTLGLMDSWNFYFWSTMVITFVVTAITAWLPPIAGLNNVAADPDPLPQPGNRGAQALAAGLDAASRQPSLGRLLLDNLRDGINMASVVAPSILAIGFLGLVLSKYTPVFDVVGTLLWPFLWLTGLPGVTAHAGALASGLAEMFLPALLLKDADLATRYIAAVTCVSSVIFFSGSVPCMLATRIPLGLGRLLVIWLLRTGLTILLASLVYRMAVGAGWLS
ncbi:histidine transporter [Deinococcus piscis]|uniref:Histidine transporter n=1 Tax=Deinococcus piscis TaxID=394230 RepID=A0ABQ3JXP7_9DEIO|nr:YjiH family protein [Deinococcus piscis]GHF94471.1 histidine transporter [Deinococcus piscis]